MNEGEVNLLKTAGLTELSFDILLPNVKYPFAVYPDGFKPATYYLKKLKSLKVNKVPFQFLMVRLKPDGNLMFDTNMKVSLEEYEIKDDVGYGFDVEVSIRLKQYRDYGTKKIVVKEDSKDAQSSKKVTVEKDRPSSKIAPKSYTVKAGDTLWAICKKQLGDGSKYQAIAKLNGINNPNLIKVGQVIKFG